MSFSTRITVQQKTKRPLPGFPAYLTFDEEADPFAVYITFIQRKDHQADWAIGLDLFVQALQEGHSGFQGGDVIMRRKTDELVITLSSKGERAIVIFPRTPLERFIQRAVLSATPEHIAAAIDTLCKRLAE